VPDLKAHLLLRTQSWGQQLSIYAEEAGSVFVLFSVAILMTLVLEQKQCNLQANNLLKP
jgi:hypothetical protein